MRLVQIKHPKIGRKVALVDEPDLILILGFSSAFELANYCIQNGKSLQKTVQYFRSTERLNYDLIYSGHSDWKLLPAFDHPDDPLHCMISGTGLTHKASAENRQAMHEAEVKTELTDSMKMYLWGLEKGHPTPDQIGVQPEWFYKGNGTVLKGHGSTLRVPTYGNDGGEEPEIAGIYIIDRLSRPWHIGFAAGNEFSDHLMERKNYLYLAPSKIRDCAIGPELVLGSDFANIIGQVSVTRNGLPHWVKKIRTGEANMAHSLANLEYHHFKYSNHLVPGLVHIHFLGADAFSFGEQITLQDGDEMIVDWEKMGRPLRNFLSIDSNVERPFKVRRLT